MFEAFAWHDLARLVVSVRTVDNQLHSVYGKLGISHRDEPAAILLPERPQI